MSMAFLLNLQTLEAPRDAEFSDMLLSTNSLGCPPLSTNSLGCALPF